jgi:ABC-type branched-subunit amino acid transport system substrate-binding protein
MRWDNRIFQGLVGAAASFFAPTLLAAQVVVGQVAPMSGIDAAQSRAYSTGMQLYFNAANKVGGVAGHTFVLVRRDDVGQPEDTLNHTRALLSEARPMVLAGYIGSRNVARVVEAGVLENERIALIGHRTTELNQDVPLLYNVRATLKDELGRITEHLATVGINRLGLFYENGPRAAALLSAAEESATNSKAKIVQAAAYDAGSGRVTSAVEAMLKASPQAIVMVSSGGAAGAFIEQYRSRGGTAQLFSHSGADVEHMAKRLSDEQMQGIAIAQVTPSPYNVNSRLTSEFNQLASSAGKLDGPISYAMLEGFIAGKVIVEAARRQGSRVSREGFVAALHSMTSFDAGGYVVGYRPGVRNGSRFVEMTIISGAGKIPQ